MIIGLLGTIFLISAFLTLNIKSLVKYFWYLDLVSAILFTIHAIIIADLPFIVTNLFVSITIVINILRTRKIEK